MDNGIRKDYGPTGCVRPSIALATVTALLLTLVRRPKPAARR